MIVEIYSDVVCPWCYIGERRFARALAAFPRAEEVEVVFRPYQLDPDAPTEAIPLTRYLEGRYGPNARGMLGQVGAAAGTEGIAIDWSRALATNTFTAHRLLRLAEREYGPATQRALVETLFDLHFSRGGDISDAVALAAAAESVGMERGRVEAYLASEEGAEELETELAHARDLGIRAVPTFVFDGRVAVEGAQPAAKFAEVLEVVSRAEG